jgi:hypothetical protein
MLFYNNVARLRQFRGVAAGLQGGNQRISPSLRFLRPLPNLKLPYAFQRKSLSENQKHAPGR